MQRCFHLEWDQEQKHMRRYERYSFTFINKKEIKHYREGEVCIK